MKLNVIGEKGNDINKNHIVNNLFIICIQRLSVPLFRKATNIYMCDFFLSFSLALTLLKRANVWLWYVESEIRKKTQKIKINSICPDIKDMAMQGLILNAHWTWLIYANESQLTITTNLCICVLNNNCRFLWPQQRLW